MAWVAEKDSLLTELVSIASVALTKVNDDTSKIRQADSFAICSMLGVWWMQHGISRVNRGQAVGKRAIAVHCQFTAL